MSRIPARCLGLEQLEDRPLLGVVRTGRVAGRRPDPLVALGDEVVVRKRLVGRVAPQLAPNLLVQPLGERLGQPVRERLGEDRRIVVVGCLELGDETVRAVEAVAGRDGERPDVVRQASLRGGNEVGQRDVRAARRLLHLLPQRPERGEAVAAIVVAPHRDVVVVHGVGGPEPDDGVRLQPVLAHDPLEQCQRVTVEVARGRTDLRVVQDRGVQPFQLPRREERRPVDPLDELGERVALEGTHAEE